MQLFEMQGLLAGKCLPGDMKVNESLAEYLLRKLEDRNELERQLSAKTISEQNIINAFGIKGEGAHSKLVIEYVHGLVALAEERREFIVNGVEHDYIELPLIEDDRANAIYQRCLLNDGYATADINAELRAQGVDEFASSIGAEAAGLSMSSNAYKAIKSTVFRAVNFAANLRTGRKG